MYSSVLLDDCFYCYMRSAQASMYLLHPANRRGAQNLLFLHELCADSLLAKLEYACCSLIHNALPSALSSFISGPCREIVPRCRSCGVRQPSWFLEVPIPVRLPLLLPGILVLLSLCKCTLLSLHVLFRKQLRCARVR